MSSFYFYDLETSGVSPRRDRVMQFAGQRTNRDLKPIGQPDNFLIKLTADILPDPYAVLITGITPQQTLASGITEAQFLRHFTDKIATSDTIILGFNNVRFDDEFMRFMLWRNFYDAYEWQWKDGCSRWDLLDLVRMTRALRPDGIKWPYAPDGKPTNRLEFLSAVNKLTHINPHDALSDVMAAIDVARLIKAKQPKLFDYLLNVRGKQKAAALVGRGEPLIYTSGKYSSEHAHTTLAVKIADHPDRSAAIVYDLRIDPKDFAELSPKELAEKWSAYGKDAPYFPAKVLAYNRCPAVAPANVLDAKSAKRLDLSEAKIAKHLKALPEDFGDKLVRALELINKERQTEMVVDPAKVDEQLYDGFVNGADKLKMSAVRAASAEAIDGLHIDFNDDRLNALLPLYKARNFPASLQPDEKAAWDKFKTQKLTGGKVDLLAQYFKKLDELSSRPALADAEKFVLEELRQYGGSVKPASWRPAAPAATKRGGAK
ncbi:MAG TPA: exodeoxyribonuclease I [Candidatus Saccharimonadales bacterium]|nr:exodeoxyribonuclease I [Candidatus Saccharimonadales bacterium]